MAQLRSKSQGSDELRDASLEGFSESIARILRGAGVSVNQFSASLRRHAVLLEAEKYPAGKANKSRIAFATDVPRATVTRLLQGKSEPSRSAMRVLITEWCSNPRFTDRGRMPSILAIFGSQKSLEGLAKRCGKGIPIRAILDELVDRGVVTILSGQRVKLNLIRIELESRVNAAGLAKYVDAVNKTIRAASPQIDSTTAGLGPEGKTRTNLKRRVD